MGKVANEVYWVEEWVTEKSRNGWQRKKESGLVIVPNVGRCFEEGEGCYFYKNWGTVCLCVLGQFRENDQGLIKSIKH
jgi:hypothetical protein